MKDCHLKDIDRRAILLDEISDAEIGKMAESEIPPVQRYSLSEIPETAE